MSFQRVRCISVDRSSAKALLQWPGVDGVFPEPVAVSYTSLPGPMSDAAVEQVESGEWLCTGPIGDVRNRLHDDFDHCTILSPSLIAQSSWDIVGNTVLLTPQTNGYGMLRLSTDGTTNHQLGIRKDPVNFGTRTGRWMEALVSISTASSRNFKVGFVDQTTMSGGGLWTPTNQLVAVSQAAVNGGAIQLAATSGGASATPIDTGFIPTAGTSFYVQLFIAGSDFAALWLADAGSVDADYSISGPWIITSNIPVGSVGPGASVQQTSTPAVALDVDFIDVYSVYPYVTPADIGAS